MRIPVRQIAALAAGAAFLATAAHADVKAGVDAWQAGNYGAAIKEWRPLAERGDPDAEFNLGQAYKLGRGVPQDLRQAQAWYEKAAERGHPQAQANLGLILFQSGERQKAMPWIRHAADAGDPRAQYVLGTALFNGDIIGKDWPRAYALMSRAAAQGLPQAAQNLTQMDNLIPLAQRQQGLALAREMERGAARPARVAPPAPPAPPRVAANRPAPTAHPAPVAVASRPAPAAAGGGWRVQLGAFGSAANAQKQWGALRGRVPALGGLRAITVPAGAVTRLQAGPLASRAAADKVCAAAKAAGSACFPVAP
jgi:cell division septation protein DedD